MDELTIRTNLRTWILAHARVPLAGPLSDDAALLDAGILTSIDVVELVLYIESLRGAEVDADALEPEVFASVDTLWEAFFTSAPGA